MMKRFFLFPFALMLLALTACSEVPPEQDLRLQAERGDPNAQYLLGSLYEHGQGMPQSHQEAVKWYRKAAEQGNVDAQFSLALAYMFGQGTPQSYEDAVVWFRKAAEQGNPAAQFNLGVAYAGGTGVPQSSEEARKWFQKAADQGFAPAKEILPHLRQVPTYRTLDTPSPDLSPLPSKGPF